MAVQKLRLRLLINAEHREHRERHREDRFNPGASIGSLFSVSSAVKARGRLCTGMDLPSNLSHFPGSHRRGWVGGSRSDSRNDRGQRSVERAKPSGGRFESACGAPALPQRLLLPARQVVLDEVFAVSNHRAAVMTPSSLQGLRFAARSEKSPNRLSTAGRPRKPSARSYSAVCR